MHYIERELYIFLTIVLFHHWIHLVLPWQSCPSEELFWHQSAFKSLKKKLVFQYFLEIHIVSCEKSSLTAPIKLFQEQVPAKEQGVSECVITAEVSTLMLTSWRITAVLTHNQAPLHPSPGSQSAHGLCFQSTSLFMEELQHSKQGTSTAQPHSAHTGPDAQGYSPSSAVTPGTAGPQECRSASLHTGRQGRKALCDSASPQRGTYRLPLQITCRPPLWLQFGMIFEPVLYHCGVLSVCCRGFRVISGDRALGFSVLMAMLLFLFLLHLQLKMHPLVHIENCKGKQIFLSPVYILLGHIYLHLASQILLVLTYGTKLKNLILPPPSPGILCCYQKMHAVY